MTAESTQAPEPTDEQRAVAKQLRIQLHQTAGWPLQDDLLACAIAAAVREEREKYLRVADELEDGDWILSDEYQAGMYRAAHRIREVSK